jgi:Xaa-Pro dipeptidase
VRAHKAPEEIEGVRESVAIADACFDRLLEIARIGITEREIGAAMYERCYALGGEDPLFLSMYPEHRNGRAEGRFGPPVDRVLERGEQLVLSFELVGRMGYWMEFARMVVFGEPTELQQRMNAAVIAGLEGGAGQMRPGKRPDEVQAAITSAVAAHGAECSYWSGHGIGQDVIEEPWLGLEIVQDRNVPSTWELADGMVLANHPYAVDRGGQAVGYMADTFLVTPAGGKAFSQKPLTLYVVE